MCFNQINTQTNLCLLHIINSLRELCYIYKLKLVKRGVNKIIRAMRKPLAFFTNLKSIHFPCATTAATRPDAKSIKNVITFDFLLLIEIRRKKGFVFEQKQGIYVRV